MRKCLLEKKNALLAAMAAVSKLYVPVDGADKQAAFAEWTEGTELSEKLNTNRSAKDFFFPQSEDIMKFRVSGKKLEIVDTRSEHEDFTTLINVAAGRGVCLAPGFLNDHSGQFAWIPFDCIESFSCVLCTHKEDQRESLGAFLNILKKLYRETVAFPL